MSFADLERGSGGAGGGGAGGGRGFRRLDNSRPPPFGGRDNHEETSNESNNNNDENGGPLWRRMVRDEMRQAVPEAWTQRLSYEVFRISSDVSSIQRMVESLGTHKDTDDMRSKLHDLTEETRKRVKSTTELIKEFATTDQAGKKIEYQKLSKDFQKVIVEFQKVQRLSAEKQREFVNQARHSSALNDYEDEDRSESGDRPLLQDSQRRMQLMVMDNELAYNESLILQREEEIRGIESGISELNEVFRDLSSLVNEQGGMLDSIENNVTSISMTTHAASEELTTAAVYQRKARKRACYLMLIVAVVAAIVVLAVLS